MIYTHVAKRIQPVARDSAAETELEDRIIEQARDILLRRMSHRDTDCLRTPRLVKDYLVLSLTAHREEFWTIWLDAQHRVISADIMFVGTLTQTSVYPREVVRDALGKHAAAVIFAHNHPSGICEPSQADESLTRQLRSALALVDVQVLDHVIVAGAQTMSFAERGLL